MGHLVVASRRVFPRPMVSSVQQPFVGFVFVDTMRIRRRPPTSSFGAQAARIDCETPKREYQAHFSREEGKTGPGKVFKIPAPKPLAERRKTRLFHLAIKVSRDTKLFRGIDLLGSAEVKSSPIIHHPLAVIPFMWAEKSRPRAILHHQPSVIYFIVQEAHML